MAKKDLKDGILGCLYTAGLGDAMGAPAEALSQKEIQERFGGIIDTFYEPNGNIYVQGNVVGEITDDTSQMYEMARAIVKMQKKITPNAAAEALVYWSEHYPKYYPRNAGATTRFVIEELKSGKDPIAVGRTGGIYNRGTSNGAAMRIAPAGMIHPGDLDSAIATAIIMTKPSHGTQHAYAGACAIACGIAKALASDAEIYNVLEACIYGAKKGEIIGMEEARIASGINIMPKLLKGIEIALSTENMIDFLQKLEYEVGNDGSIQTSVAAAVSIFAAVKGDPQLTVIYGANLGGDTDTIGCIAGMLSGAYSGYRNIPKEWIDIFDTANPKIKLAEIGEELYNLLSSK